VAKPVLRTLRRWGALLFALAVFLVLAWVDARMKTAPFEGFCPNNAVWIVGAEDFPSFCRGVDQSDLGARYPKALRKHLADFQLRVRKETGIRPTPLRGRVWMGPTLLAAYDGRDAGFCVRPGLLLRGFERVGRTLHRIPADQRIGTFGTVYYAWREGFLIVSASRDYVAACLEAHPVTIEPSQARNELRLCFRGSSPAVLRIRGEDGLPISGWFQGDFTHRTTPLTLAELVLGDPRPILWVVATEWQDLRDFGALTLRIIDCFSGKSTEDIARVAQTMAVYLGEQWNLDALPADWDSGVQECAAGLFNIDTTMLVPVPELALILRCAEPTGGPHPLTRLASAVSMLPYEWEGIPGVRVPWLGEKATFCLAGAGRDWFLTTQEPLMAALLAAPRGNAALKADLALRFEWDKAMDVVSALLRQAARYELIPRMNSNDVEERLMPVVQDLAELGRFELNARCEEGRVLFDGYVARAKKGPNDEKR